MSTVRGSSVSEGRQCRRAVVSAVIGNALEWFDFGVYGMFAVIIARIFFPTDDPLTSLMLAMGTFGLAFVVRPIGGVLIGMYADRAGRKAALSLIILLMALGTGIIGLTPPYAVIGILAPILIMTGRLLQGLSAGGEFASATAMLIENSAAKQRGLIGSLQMCSQALAFSLGGASAYLLDISLSPEALHDWGWRLPFLFGMLIGPVGYYIRRRVDETPEFTAFVRSRSTAPRIPLTQVMACYRQPLLAAFGMVAVGAAAGYVVMIFMPMLAVSRLGISMGNAQFAMLCGALVLFLLCPLAGWLSDRFGRIRIMLPAVVLFGALAYPLLSRLVAEPSAASLLEYVVASSVIMSFFWGPLPAALAEIFPVQVRSTGMSLVYNVAVTLFGGLAPLFNTWLAKVTNDLAAPALYLVAAALIGISGLTAATRLPRKE